MDAFRPLSAVLFFYECFRVLLLAIIWSVAPLEAGFPSGSYANGIYLPYFVYLSANALFPMMALFVWLKPDEYRNYLTLYMAGKVIGVVTFYVWEIFSSREYPGVENVVKSLILLGTSIFLSLADILSVWGAWTLKNKFRQVQAWPPSGELNQVTEPGGQAESGGI